MYLVSVAAYWAPVRYCNRYPGLDHPSLRKNGATRGARSAPGLDSFALSGAGVSKRQALFFWRAFLGAIVSHGFPTPVAPGLDVTFQQVVHSRQTRGAECSDVVLTYCDLISRANPPARAFERQSLTKL